MKTKNLYTLILIASLMLTACGSKDTEVFSSTVSEIASSASANVTDVSDLSSDVFTDRDLAGEDNITEYTDIILSSDTASCSDTGVDISSGCITIANEGIYRLSGSYSGTIRIDADDSDKVQLLLDGTDLTSDGVCSIYVANADKVFITLAEGSTNTFTHTGGYSDDDSCDAPIFSHDDLVINGNGSLSIVTNEGNGIVSKDDLKIVSGNIDITCEKHGLEANESLDIADGNIVIHDSFEGIEAMNIAIYGGNIDITSSDDGINASGDGSCSIDIYSGTVRINASGDGIDSNGTFNMNGGALYISGPENNGNAALDYQTSSSVTGGTVIALGSSGMALNFGSGSTQCSVLYNLEATYDAGLEISLCDSEGNSLISYTAESRFNSILLSHPDLMTGETFTLKIGDDEFNITLDSTQINIGTQTFGGPGMEGMGGFGGPGTEGLGEPGMGGFGGQGTEGLGEPGMDSFDGSDTDGEFEGRGKDGFEPPQGMGSEKKPPFDNDQRGSKNDSQ
ncbi:MAG: carbohydrate-binding domain-containing protein [Lachnospiraceae bacterium]|nr:carbohydrate-binding domain-containing protein [Lachnospiraceae bacterium]